jgi:VIT1/CCC1 family predicted Fe2+/Mn2+ transporter
MNDLLSEFADAAEQMASVPDSLMKQMSEAAKEMVSVSREVEQLEEQLKQKKTRLYDLETKILPDIMNQIGADVTGVDGIQIELQRKIHANISKDWEDSRKIAAYDHLREIGGEDLIKQTMIVSAGKGSDEKMTQIAQRVRQMLAEVSLDASLSMEPSVQWNTLTSFVKSVLKEGDTPVDLEVIGATDITVAKIVRKKEK